MPTVIGFERPSCKGGKYISFLRAKNKRYSLAIYATYLRQGLEQDEFPEGLLVPLQKGTQETTNDPDEVMIPLSSLEPYSEALQVCGLEFRAMLFIDDVYNDKDKQRIPFTFKMEEHDANEFVAGLNSKRSKLYKPRREIIVEPALPPSSWDRIEKGFKSAVRILVRIG